jgi:hypothetical protein
LDIFTYREPTSLDTHKPQLPLIVIDQSLSREFAGHHRFADVPAFRKIAYPCGCLIDAGSANISELGEFLTGEEDSAGPGRTADGLARKLGRSRMADNRKLPEIARGALI